MKSVGYSRYALTICAASALLAGCGGAAVDRSAERDAAEPRDRGECRSRWIVDPPGS